MVDVIGQMLHTYNAGTLCCVWHTRLWISGKDYIEIRPSKNKAYAKELGVNTARKIGLKIVAWEK